MSSTPRIATLFVVTGAAVAAVCFLSPIPQDPAYHDFADQRSWLGIRNTLDVLSNLAFLVVGMLGLLESVKRTASPRIETVAWAVLFTGVLLTGIGSAYYHWQPTTERLFWDRLPMTICFMSLTALLVADRIQPAILPWLLPLLLAAGVFSILHWRWTESDGRGDLRFYGLVQFLPIVVLGLTLWLFPKGRIPTHGLLIAFAWYAAAKLLEHFDEPIFDLTGFVSGHTLKHLAAAAALEAIRRMGRGAGRHSLPGTKRKRSSPAERHALQTPP